VAVVVTTLQLYTCAQTAYHQALQRPLPIAVRKAALLDGGADQTARRSGTGGQGRPLLLSLFPSSSKQRRTSLAPKENPLLDTVGSEESLVVALAATSGAAVPSDHPSAAATAPTAAASAAAVAPAAPPISLLPAQSAVWGSRDPLVEKVWTCFHSIRTNFRRLARGELSEEKVLHANQELLHRLQALHRSSLRERKALSRTRADVKIEEGAVRMGPPRHGPAPDRRAVVFSCGGLRGGVGACALAAAELRRVGRRGWERLVQ
jgi:hypothetical protein